MKFWKFEAPSEDQLKSFLTTDALPPQVSVPGLLNTFELVLKKLKPGHIVVLANRIGGQGRIVALGKVLALENNSREISLQWVKVSYDVYPTDSGLEHWKAKTAFEISAEPAKRYKLQRLVDLHLKDAA